MQAKPYIYCNNTKNNLLHLKANKETTATLTIKAEWNQDNTNSPNNLWKIVLAQITLVSSSSLLKNSSFLNQLPKINPLWSFYNQDHYSTNLGNTENATGWDWTSRWSKSLVLVVSPGAGWDFKNLGEMTVCTGVWEDFSLPSSRWLQATLGQSATTRKKNKVHASLLKN